MVLWTSFLLKESAIGDGEAERSEEGERGSGNFGADSCKIMPMDL